MCKPEDFFFQTNDPIAGFEVDICILNELTVQCVIGSFLFFLFWVKTYLLGGIS